MLPPGPKAGTTRAAADRQIIRVIGRPAKMDRPSLPAGHPITWRLLTDGTSLQDSPYPYPVFST